MATKKNMTVPWLRRRTQSSTTDHYYLEIPNSKPRKEIALGSNLDEALARRQTFLKQYWDEHPLSIDPLVNLLLQYKHIHVPLLDKHSKKENFSSLKHLVNFFSSHKCDVCAIESPMVAHQYLFWRNSKLPMRAKSELSLLKRVVKVSQRLHA